MKCANISALNSSELFKNRSNTFENMVISLKSREASLACHSKISQFQYGNPVDCLCISAFQPGSINLSFTCIESLKIQDTLYVKKYHIQRGNEKYRGFFF